jgi:gluconolactonase
LPVGGGARLVPAHRSLVWSDIPNDRMLRFDEASGGWASFASPAATPMARLSIDRDG